MLNRAEDRITKRHEVSKSFDSIPELRQGSEETGLATGWVA